MELTMVIKCSLLLVVSCALLTSPVAARPPHRQKRVSDQRLAELETLLALAKMNNRKYVTLPVGYGLIDVHKIGRRKRSAGLGQPRDPAGISEYDLGDLIAGLASKYSSNDDDSILDSNYSVEDEEEGPEEDVDVVSSEVGDSGVSSGGSVSPASRKGNIHYLLGDLRPNSKGFYLGMRDQQRSRFF